MTTSPQIIKIPKELYNDCERYLPSHWVCVLFDDVPDMSSYRFYSILFNDETVSKKIEEDTRNKYDNTNSIFITTGLTIIPVVMAVLYPIIGFTLPVIIISILFIIAMIRIMALNNELLSVKHQTALSIIRELKTLSN